MSLTVVLVAYLCVMLPMTHAAARNDMFSGLRIMVHDTAHTGFVNAADIDSELQDLSTRIKKTRRKDLNTLKIENRLRASDKIEDVHVTALANGELCVDVVPMRPVARVFDSSGSYYINRIGKRIGADARYHADVPVISGNVGSPADVAKLLPMFDFIRNHPQYDALVTQVVIDPGGDIIVVPSVAGHVINLGDTSMIADKMERLGRFYHDVANVRGWEYYDSLSVKWRGRLVATRATKRTVDNRPLTELDGIVDEVPDAGTQTAPGL